MSPRNGGRLALRGGLSGVLFLTVTLSAGRAAYEGDIRLVRGADDAEGVVQVFHCRGKDCAWGVVCNHGWTDADAAVACRQAGQPSSTATAIRDVYAEFGARFPSDMPVYFDDIGCTGNEALLKDCIHQGFAPGDKCTERDAAGVRCSGLRIHAHWWTLAIIAAAIALVACLLLPCCRRAGQPKSLKERGLDPESNLMDEHVVTYREPDKDRKHAPPPPRHASSFKDKARPSGGGAPAGGSSGPGHVSKIGLGVSGAAVVAAAAASSGPPTRSSSAQKMKDKASSDDKRKRAASPLKRSSSSKRPSESAKSARDDPLRKGGSKRELGVHDDDRHAPRDDDRHHHHHHHGHHHPPHEHVSPPPTSHTQLQQQQRKKSGTGGSFKRSAAPL